MRITLIYLFIFSIGWSQASLELSLQDALRLSDENNLTLKKARLDYDVSVSQKQEAKSSAYPVISTFAQGTKNLSIATQPISFPVPFGILDATGNPVAQIDANGIPLPLRDAYGNVVPGQMQKTGIQLIPVNLAFGQDNTLVYGFNITQPLFDGRVLAALRSAGTYEIMAQSGLNSQKSLIIEQTTSQYYSALVTNRVLAVMKKSLELANRHLKDAQALYAIGNAAELSVIQAEVRVANAETQVSQARKTKELTQSMLKRTCGLPMDQDIILTEQLDAPVEDIPTYKELSKKLLENQPILRQLEANQKLMRENILLKKAEFMPSLALTGSYSQQLPYNDGQFSDGVFREASSVGVALSFPIFNGFGSKARLDQAKATFQSSKYTYKDTENALLMELSQLYYSAKEAILRISAGDKQVNLAHRGAEIAESLYQKGMSTDLEYQDAINGLRQAELGLAQAYYEYHTALAGIQRSTGINNF
ncbi:MAG: TolC family protein [Candidatus Marinimicrobia bacterium]|nr:TolC family protein [Candidatus Neomarinimicrobiota bacterium]